MLRETSATDHGRIDRPLHVTHRLATSAMIRRTAFVATNAERHKHCRLQSPLQTFRANEGTPLGCNCSCVHETGVETKERRESRKDESSYFIVSQTSRSREAGVVSRVTMGESV